MGCCHQCTGSLLLRCRSEMPERVSQAQPREAGALRRCAAAAQALESGGAPKPGARVLIQGGSGGVGHFAIQLAKVHFKAYAVATGGPKNQALMKVMRSAAALASTQGRLLLLG